MIELTDLQKVVDQHLAVDIETLKVGSGEIAALVGPMEGTRTILLDLLTGQSRPTVGTIRIAGITPSVDRQRFSHQVGVLFPQDGLYAHRTARANLVFHCQLRGLPRSRAEETLLTVGLADHANVRAEKLAPGLARRLAFGRAILHAPHVFLLADPLARCDDASAALLAGLIRRFSEDGAALLVIAENPASVATFCDVIYVMSQGKIVEEYMPGGKQDIKMPFKIPARLEDKIALLNPGDILYAEAGEGRAFVITATDRMPTQFTLTELEERLSRSGFFRAHRGYLVNLQHVKEVIPYTRNSSSLRLDDDARSEIPLSKSAASELRELLGY